MNDMSINSSFFSTLHFGYIRLNFEWENGVEYVSWISTNVAISMAFGALMTSTLTPFLTNVIKVENKIGTLLLLIKSS